MFQLLLCTLSITNILYGFKRIEKLAEGLIDLSFIFKLSFFTFWNLYLIMLFSIALIVYKFLQLFLKNKTISIIKYFCKIIYGCVLTFSILISSVYWLSKIFDSNLFVSKSILDIKVNLDLLTDFNLHLFPTLLLLMLWKFYSFSEFAEIKFFINFISILYAIFLNLSIHKTKFLPYNFMNYLKCYQINLLFIPFLILINLIFSLLKNLETERFKKRVNKKVKNMKIKK